MKVSEAFLVNTKNFDTIVDTLVKQDRDDAVINSSLLEDLGFSDPNDLLVVRILKDFDIIDNDGKPDKYFQEFIHPQTTKIALAKGLISAYERLFEEYPKIHHAPEKKVKQAFEEIFKGKKTDLIIKYISGTFQKITSYVGLATIDATLDDDPQEVKETAVVETAAAKHANNGTAHQSENEKESDGEYVNTKSIDDIINEFDKQVQDSSGDNKQDKEGDDLTLRQSKNGEPKDEFGDPFNFEQKDSSESPETTSESKEYHSKKASNKEKIDMAPSDLDIPLSNAAESENSDTKPREHEFVKKALIRKSDLLQKMNRWEELISTLEEIIRRYDNSDHPELDEAVSRSIIRRAVALLKLQRNDEALSALNSVINRFKDSEKKEFYNQASRAMLYKATILEKNNSNGLLPLYNAIIDRLEMHSEIFMKEKLDDIHLKRFDLIVDEGESSDIFDACTKLIQRFKDQDEHRTYLQKAMVIRAEMLDEMGREEEALAAYDQFLRAFG